jgi:hypothetical protein
MLETLRCIPRNCSSKGRSNTCSNWILESCGLCQTPGTFFLVIFSSKKLTNTYF